MPKITDHRKPYKNQSITITEEYFDTHKDFLKLSKNDWRLNKRELKFRNSCISVVMRKMMRLYVTLRKKEEETGKKFDIKIIERQE